MSDPITIEQAEWTLYAHTPDGDPPPGRGWRFAHAADGLVWWQRPKRQKINRAHPPVLMTIDEAVALLKMRHSDGAEMIRELGLVTVIDGHQRVPLARLLKAWGGLPDNVDADAPIPFEGVSRSPGRL